MKKLLPITVAFGLTCLVSLAKADMPGVFCVGTESGGWGGPRLYAYEVSASSFMPVIELRVGTNDLDPFNYTDVLLPNNWNFALEQVPMAHYLGLKTLHGEVSPGPSPGLTAGSVHWWTDDPDFAVSGFFTFGYDNPWPSEDVGWILEGQELLEGQPYTMTEFWGEPVGELYGPLHGPVPEPTTIALLGLGALMVRTKRTT